MDGRSRVGHLIEQLLVVGEDLGEGAGGAEAVAELPLQRRDEAHRVDLVRRVLAQDVPRQPLAQDAHPVERLHRRLVARLFGGELRELVVVLERHLDALHGAVQYLLLP